eukprot:scaffold3058_cov177-Amphora_coffeaeformis.AAC.1
MTCSYWRTSTLPKPTRRGVLWGKHSSLKDLSDSNRCWGIVRSDCVKSVQTDALSSESLRTCSETHCVALSSKDAFELERRRIRVMKSSRGRPMVNHEL